MDLADIIIKLINSDDISLSNVIYDSIGNPTPHKISEIIESYNKISRKLFGAFENNTLIAVIGISINKKLINIHHISILKNFRKQGIGTLLFNEVRKRYSVCNVLAKTDDESVNFYIKLGFNCQRFINKYENIRYKCKFVK